MVAEITENKADNQDAVNLTMTDAELRKLLEKVGIASKQEQPVQHTNMSTENQQMLDLLETLTEKVNELEYGNKKNINVNKKMVTDNPKIWRKDTSKEDKSNKKTVNRKNTNIVESFSGEKACGQLVWAYTVQTSSMLQRVERSDKKVTNGITDKY